MDGKLQTSFIPKQPLVETKTTKVSGTTSIFSMIGWFIFLIAVLASLGVYAYEKYIGASITSKNAELTRRIKSFDAASVDHFVRLNARFQAANTLLNNHLAVSALLKLISESTVGSIQFTDIKYVFEDTGKISLAMSGRAPNFASVALQSDTFTAQPFLRNQVFSNLGLDADGSVLFRFTATVEPSSIQYKAETATTI